MTGGVGSVGKPRSPAVAGAWRGGSLCRRGRSFHRRRPRAHSTRRAGAFHRDSVDTAHPCTLRTMVSIVVLTSTLVFIFCSMSLREWITVEWSLPPNIFPITGSEAGVS